MWMARQARARGMAVYGTIARLLFWGGCIMLIMGLVGIWLTTR